MIQDIILGERKIIESKPNKVVDLVENGLPLLLATD